MPTVCTIKKSIEIKAPKKKVWNVLIDPKFVAIWSSEFSPGSHVEGDFTTGSTVIFKDGEGNGLRGKVINHTLHEYLKIEYDASLKNGVLEGQESDETKKWTGCLDMYEVLERGRVIQFDQSCLTDNPA